MEARTEQNHSGGSNRFMRRCGAGAPAPYGPQRSLATACSRSPEECLIKIKDYFAILTKELSLHKCRYSQLLHGDSVLVYLHSPLSREDVTGGRQRQQEAILGTTHFMLRMKFHAQDSQATQHCWVGGRWTTRHNLSVEQPS